MKPKQWRVSRPKTRAQALDSARKAALELGIETPRVIWFTETSPGAEGSYWRNRAMIAESRSLEKGSWLHISLRGDLLIETIAHEAKHVSQFRRGALHPLASANTDTDHAIAEADARAWSAAFLARLTGRPLAEQALEESPVALLKDLRDAIANLRA
jgi:uncharacterized protein DUF6782